MAQPSFSNYASFEWLKLNQTVAYDFTRRQYPKAEMTLGRGYGALKYERELDGVGPFKPLPGGGYAVQMKLKNGIGASGTLPNSSNSIADAGSFSPTLDPLQVSPFFFFANAQTNEAQAIGAQTQFAPEQYINWLTDKAQGVIEAFAIMAGSTFSTTGYNYNIDTVASDFAGVSITDATTSFEIEVNNLDRWQVGGEYEFANGNTVVPNLGKGIVYGKDSKSGPGTISVKFPDFVSSGTISASFNCNYYGGRAWSANTGNTAPNGWQEWVKDAAHPRAPEGGNVAVSAEYYRPVRYSIEDAKINPDDMFTFLANMEDHGSSSGVTGGGFSNEASMYTDDQGIPLYRAAFVTHPRTIRQLQLNYKDRVNLNTFGVPVKFDSIVEDQLKYEAFQGIPLRGDFTCDLSEMYLLNMGFVGVGIVKEFGPPLQYRNMGDFIPVTGGSLNYVLPRNMAMLAVPLQRDRIGYLYGNGNIGLPLTHTSNPS